jgi:superfamily II DNA or RNA helicase
MARRNESALTRLPEWPDWSPALDTLQHAFPNVEPTEDDIRALWHALIIALATPETVANDTLTDLWAAAAKDGVVPECLPSSQGDVALAKVYVTSSPDLAHRARRPNRITVTLDEVTLDRWLDRGARNLSELLEPEWESAVGPAQRLIEVFPDLGEVLRPKAREAAGCQPVSDLRLRVDKTMEPLQCLMWQGMLLLDLDQLEGCSRSERLRLLLNEIASAGWLDCSPEEALQRLGDAGVDQLRADVAQGATLPERLLRAVGNRREPLLQALGALKGMSFVQQCTPLTLAELTLAQLGPSTLTALKDTLEAEGLNPPKRWNTSQARAFVASINFPPEFASAPETKREAEEFISGPIELPPLHDFQEEVMRGLQALFESGARRRRAVVSLPTGGGKTRVTVEAAVRLVLAPESDVRSVVWVAQTDELCEQAVQAFRQVWVNLGAEGTDLRVVRLWGGNPSPAIQGRDRPVVVVASIQTLNSRRGAEGLAWLSKPGLVVVDECHHAITPSYSNLLRWLDAEAPRPGAPQKDEPPILGLSATPFRTDDDESQRLARRFDNRWLPTDQEMLHARLCTQGVLAHADYEALESGAGLLKEEIDRLAGLPEPWEGLDFENLLEAINQRLARDATRNERLVDRIRQCAERSILFFANSVEHAEEMSARLNLAGITAAAVSGTTPAVARRYFLDRFRRDEVQVLCNHSILATGFDAPKTDMVFIARQVFSPVRYMQMIGRGLRGEKNGGTARCRIVTVVDNLGRFQDRHPYHYCKQLYTGGA